MILNYQPLFPNLGIFTDPTLIILNLPFLGVNLLLQILIFVDIFHKCIEANGLRCFHNSICIYQANFVKVVFQYFVVLIDFTLPLIF
jgi:hypothetical protein